MSKRRQWRFPTRLRVMAEYASSGIWVAEPMGLFRHGMIEHKGLGLPDQLAASFAAWIERYWGRLQNGFDIMAFNTEGRALAVALKAFVGADTEVVFQAEVEDGGLRAEETVQAQ
jgi:hypothetical protein